MRSCIINIKLPNEPLTLEQMLPVSWMVDQLYLLTPVGHFFVDVKL